jgi:hypothetical protein
MRAGGDGSLGETPSQLARAVLLKSFQMPKSTFVAPTAVDAHLRLEEASPNQVWSDDEVVFAPLESYFFLIQ